MLIKGNKLPYIARIRFHLAKRRVLLLQAQKLSRKYNISNENNIHGNNVLCGDILY